MTTYFLPAGSLQHYAALARERGLPRHHGFDSWLWRGERVRLLTLQRRAHPRYREYLYSEWEFRWHGGENRFALPLGPLLSDLPALKRKVLRLPDHPAEPSPKKVFGKAPQSLDLYPRSTSPSGQGWSSEFLRVSTAPNEPDWMTRGPRKSRPLDPPLLCRAIIAPPDREEAAEVAIRRSYGRIRRAFAWLSWRERVYVELTLYTHPKAVSHGAAQHQADTDDSPGAA